MIVVDSGASTLLLPSSHGLYNVKPAKATVLYANDDQGSVKQKGTLRINGAEVEGYVAEDLSYSIIA